MMTQNELRKRWVEALRSGEYVQGFYSLRDERGRYCCLGVLCDLYDSTGWDSQGAYKENTELPPEEVLAAVGIDENYAITISEANDDYDAFYEIADSLEIRFSQLQTEKECLKPQHDNKA